METKPNACSRGEGKEQCIWWVTGCIKPSVNGSIKRRCNGKLVEREKEAVSP